MFIVTQSFWRFDIGSSRTDPFDYLFESLDAFVEYLEHIGLATIENIDREKLCVECSVPQPDGTSIYFSNRLYPIKGYVMKNPPAQPEQMQS